jgi:A/G-specific adenine glycosylase
MMLQQTQVKTVIPYYQRFIRELPNWKSLAGADPEKILKLWEGLGYYRRARNLRAAAQKILDDFGGRLPDTLPEILELPGVGPYSAGALLSIAHAKPYPLVDGNVIRVYSRLFLLRGNLKSGPGHAKVWDIARKLVPGGNPGDFNQALMELGATICLSQDPLCLICPLSSRCLAARNGTQNDLPETPKAPRPLEVPMAAAFVEKGGRVLVKRRSETERWLKNMWEFPSAEGKTIQAAKRKLERDSRIRLGKKALREVRHQITHHKIRLKLFPGRLPGGSKPSPAFKWVNSRDLLRLPFASAQGKFRKWVLESGKLNRKSGNGL